MAQVIQEIIDCFNNLDTDILNGANHNRRDYVHRLFQYPAMMVPSVQEPILKAVLNLLPSDPWIIDPYMGSATSFATSMKYGFNIFGQDINPLSLLISQVKTGPYIKGSTCRLKEVLNKILEDKNQKVEVSFTNLDKWFESDVQIELSKIRRGIMSEKQLLFRKFLWVAFAETIRLSSNDRTSTFKLHVRPKSEIELRRMSPIKMFSEISNRNMKDITQYRTMLNDCGWLHKDKYIKNITLKLGDSAKRIRSLKKFDLLLTSPPYGDNKTTVTYGQYSYLPLQWINLKDIDPDIDSDCLKTTAEIDTRSLGGKAYQNLLDIKENLFSISNELKQFYCSFDSNDHSKINKVLYFFYDFNKSIKNIVNSINKDGYLIFTIGNRHVGGKELHNTLILKELLEFYGVGQIVDLKREIQNKRMPSRNNISKTMGKENVLIFKR